MKFRSGFNFHDAYRRHPKVITLILAVFGEMKERFRIILQKRIIATNQETKSLYKKNENGNEHKSGNFKLRPTKTSETYDSKLWVPTP